MYRCSVCCTTSCNQVGCLWLWLTECVPCCVFVRCFLFEPCGEKKKLLTGFNVHVLTNLCCLFFYTMNHVDNCSSWHQRIHSSVSDYGTAFCCKFENLPCTWNTILTTCINLKKIVLYRLVLALVSDGAVRTNSLTEWRRCQLYRGSNTLIIVVVSFPPLPSPSPPPFSSSLLYRNVTCQLCGGSDTCVIVVVFTPSLHLRPQTSQVKSDQLTCVYKEASVQLSRHVL